MANEKGLIPAFHLPSNYGFEWAEKFDFYPAQEIREILKVKIKEFELREI